MGYWADGRWLRSFVTQRTAGKYSGRYRWLAHQLERAKLGGADQKHSVVTHSGRQWPAGESVFRSAGCATASAVRSGETGARNILRGMGFFSLDAGLYKSFAMPWSENHKLTIRWETFNVTNTQYLTGNADVTNGLDPQFGSPPATFYNFTGIQGTPRVMQFALRYDF